MRFGKFILALATLAAAKPALAVHGINLKGVLDNAKTAKYIFETGLFNQIFAKETCSCLYVDHQKMEDCQATDNLPAIAHKVVTITPSVSPDDPDMTKARTVTSRFNIYAKTVAGALVKLGPPATARFVSPEFGCVMTTPAPVEP